MNAEQYIKRIRNQAKREYARAFWAWLQSDMAGKEPARGALSCMAAQAVRMNLWQFQKESKAVQS